MKELQIGHKVILENGEGVLIAWRSLWMVIGGKPTGDWKWIFQAQGI